MGVDKEFSALYRFSFSLHGNVGRRRMSLVSTYLPSYWTLSKVEGSEVKAQLLLALAWFHGIVQERRIFMPQGWTKEYDFSVGDLR